MPSADGPHAWLRACRATNEDFTLDLASMPSTFKGPRFEWPVVEGSKVMNGRNGNSSQAGKACSVAGKVAVREANARAKLCPDGQVFNPFDSTCRARLPILSLFDAALQQSPPVTPTFSTRLPLCRLIRDYFGNLRPWSWDCETNQGKFSAYAQTNPSRALQCAAAEGTTAEPIIEEEYFQWGHALLAAASAERGGTFVVAEIGARYGPWAMRAARAAEVLGRSKSFHVITVDPETLHVGWTREHFALNGMVAPRFKLDVVQARFCDQLQGERKTSTGTLSVVRRSGMRLENCIASILKNVDHVDYLDIDAQGAEKLMVLSDVDKAALRAKVRRTHIETHSDLIWAGLEKALVPMGFKVMQNATWMYSAYRSENFGPTWWRGGQFYAINTALVSC